MSNENQGTDFWRATRVSVVTASRFKDCLMRETTKTFWGTIWSLVAESLTDEAPPEVNAAALSWGKEHEQNALDGYMLESGNHVEQVGLQFLDGNPLIGASPDGLVAPAGSVEIKCPHNSREHIRHLLTGPNEEYIPQIQGVMWVCERQWCDFISYDPRMPPGLDLYVKRINRDHEYIEDVLAPKVCNVVEKANEAIEELRDRIAA